MDPNTVEKVRREAKGGHEHIALLLDPHDFQPLLVEVHLHLPDGRRFEANSGPVG
jgi:hypothetical protein